MTLHAEGARPALVAHAGRGTGVDGAASEVSELELQLALRRTPESVYRLVAMLHARAIELTRLTVHGPRFPATTAQNDVILVGLTVRVPTGRERSAIAALGRCVDVVTLTERNAHFRGDTVPRALA